MRGGGWLVFAVSWTPFLYAAGLFLAGLSAGELAGVLLTCLLTLGLGVYYLWPHSAGEIVVPIVFLGLSLFLLATAANPGALEGLGAVVWVGMLAAAPLVLLLVSTHPDRGPGGRLVAFQIALLDGLAMLATRQFFVTGSTSVSTANLLIGYLDTIHAQLVGLGVLVSGGSSASLPLASVNDATFVVLAALALVTTIVSIVRPMTGRGVELPTAPGAARGPSGSDGELAGVPASFREVLRSRSRSEGPPKGEFPDVPAFAVAVGAAAVFLALLYTIPAWALFLTVLGTVIGVATLIALLFRRLGARARVGRARESRGSPPEASREVPEF